jgi:hypothetical protein
MTSGKMPPTEKTNQPSPEQSQKPPRLKISDIDRQNGSSPIRTGCLTGSSKKFLTSEAHIGFPKVCHILSKRVGADWDFHSK